MFFLFSPPQNQKYETILSRCFITLSSINPDEINNNLKKILQKKRLPMMINLLNYYLKKLPGALETH